MVMAVDLPTKGAVSVFYFTHYNVSFYFEATAIFSLSMGASRWGQKGPECSLLVKEGGGRDITSFGPNFVLKNSCQNISGICLIL